MIFGQAIKTLAGNVLQFTVLCACAFFIAVHPAMGMTFLAVHFCLSVCMALISIFPYKNYDSYALLSRDNYGIEIILSRKMPQKTIKITQPWD